MTDSQRWFVLVLILIGMVFVYFLSPILLPFLVAFLLAYLLDPLVTKLRRLKIPRIVSALLVFVFVLFLILFFMFMLIPALEKQITVLMHKLPEMIGWLEQSVLPWVNKQLHINLNIDISNLRDELLKRLNESGPKMVKTLINTLFSSGHVVFEIIMNIILIPVVTLYLLTDWETVTHQSKRFLPFPPSKRETAVKLIRECGDVLAGFFRGQLMVMIGLGVVYTVGLSLVGLDLAVLIGVSAGLLSVVPYLGFIVGILASVAAAFLQFHDWLHIVGVLGVFAVGQICESFIFSPFFVGDRIGLHPVAVIFAVLAGGKLFGFVGVLLALPVAAVIMVFVRYMRDNYFVDKPIETIDAETT